MGFTSNNNRNLTVSEALNEIVRIGIGGNVDDSIFNALTVERAGGCGALDAGGLAIDGNVHFFLTGDGAFPALSQKHLALENAYRQMF